MKFLLLMSGLLFADSTYAMAKTGSCVMGSGDNQVKIFFQIESSSVLVSYEGTEDEKDNCELVSNVKNDYSILCRGDESEDNLEIVIKGSTGQMNDGSGDQLARLTKCRIR